MKAMSSEQKLELEDQMNSEVKQFSKTLDFGHLDKAKEIFEKLTLAEVTLDMPKVDTYERFTNKD